MNQQITVLIFCAVALIFTSIILPVLEKRKIKKTGKKTPDEIHAEISQQILSNGKLIEIYFSNPCTRTTTRKH